MISVPVVGLPLKQLIAPFVLCLCAAFAPARCLPSTAVICMLPVSDSVIYPCATPLECLAIPQP